MGSVSYNIKMLKLAVLGSIICFTLTAAIYAQQDTDKPVVVRPGAPGEATKVLPAETTAHLPEHSKKDAEFMQGMIMHHGQAVEMTALIADRTTNEHLTLLGAKITQSQSDEMRFMRRWLALRGEPTEMQMSGSGGALGGMHHSMMMPGMLSKKQMDELKNAKGVAFDRLFLQGMIQHHRGALTMVKDLFDTPGSGQDAELFNFAADVDTGQRAEIKIMETMLSKIP